MLQSNFRRREILDSTLMKKIYDRERKLPTYVYTILFFITQMYVNRVNYSRIQNSFAKEVHLPFRLPSRAQR